MHLIGSRRTLLQTGRRTAVRVCVLLIVCPKGSNVQRDQNGGARASRLASHALRSITASALCRMSTQCTRSRPHFSRVKCFVHRLNPLSDLLGWVAGQSNARTLCCGKSRTWNELRLQEVLLQLEGATRDFEEFNRAILKEGLLCVARVDGQSVANASPLMPLERVISLARGPLKFAGPLLGTLCVTTCPEPMVSSSASRRRCTALSVKHGVVGEARRPSGANEIQHGEEHRTRD
mmetsp:Transcript_16551/g.37889  ORF Transcript_16551/g.37889 Transcript_16551/m.37889 type:complete len:235 (-) Transcript_16551:28-732(-)